MNFPDCMCVHETHIIQPELFVFQLSFLTSKALLMRGERGGLRAASPQWGGWWLQCCWAASGSPIRKVSCRRWPCRDGNIIYNERGQIMCNLAIICGIWKDNVAEMFNVFCRKTKSGYFQMATPGKISMTLSMKCCEQHNINSTQIKVQQSKNIWHSIWH